MTKDCIWMKPLASDLFECVILPGLANCVLSNSDDPPGSFHTGDVFVPHATLPDRWKLVGRTDDLINMSFSETFVALPFEDHVRSHPLVDEAVVFGNGRPKLGLLVFCSEAARGLEPEQVLDGIWQRVEQANRRGKPWTRVDRSMVVVLQSGTAWPKTDKQNVIRPMVLRQFEDVIDAMYDGVDDKGIVEPHAER
jgi:long-subunit acyl-CoA synthetase (AMP-forming)